MRSVIFSQCRDRRMGVVSGEWRQLSLRYLQISVSAVYSCILQDCHLSGNLCMLCKCEFIK